MLLMHVGGIVDLHLHNGYTTHPKMVVQEYLNIDSFDERRAVVSPQKAAVARATVGCIFVIVVIGDFSINGNLSRTCSMSL